MQGNLREDKYMSIMLKRNVRRTWTGIFATLLDIASHPALASHVPAGPGSLATGQVAAAARGGRPVRSNLGSSASGDSAQLGDAGLEWSGA